MRDLAVTSDPSSGSLKATKNLSTKSVANTALQTSSVILLPFLNGLWAGKVGAGQGRREKQASGSPVRDLSYQFAYVHTSAKATLTASLFPLSCLAAAHACIIWLHSMHSTGQVEGPGLTSATVDLTQAPAASPEEAAHKGGVERQHPARHQRR